MQVTQERKWYLLETDRALKEQGVNAENGLNAAEVQKRLAQHGPNELVEKGVKSPLLILWEQLQEPMVLILIAAAVVSAFLGKADSVIAIMLIVVLNAVLGVFQEYRAEKAMAALKKMAAPAVRVRRDGKVIDVKSSEVVPGDVIFLEAGSIVPADGRLLESANLRVQEASLTGESEPVEKFDEAIHGKEEVPIGDRQNMVFMGTAVTYGRGTAMITDTGMKTQLGRIAELIQNVDSDKTPLQRRMAELGKALLVIAILIVITVFGLGMINGEDPTEIFVAAVAVAVAVVPEGLPAVVTISLALGAQRMLKRQALIRKLPAVETLGSVTIICSDKTGTLTQNLMTVTVLDVDGQQMLMSQLLQEGHHVEVVSETGAAEYNKARKFMLAGGALCNDAILEKKIESDDFIAVGDPTEGALLVAAQKWGMQKANLDKMLPRVSELPFTSERKRMTTIHRINGAKPATPAETHFRELISEYKYIAFTKGAADGLLEVSDHYWSNAQGGIMPMTPEMRKNIENANNQLAKNGLRVLGVAFRPLDNEPTAEEVQQIENKLVFVGMVGIIDPPRPEVKAAVETCLAAGIRPIMITGDHPLTALSIAKELNIARSERILTGHELAKMSAAELEAVVEEVSVFARVAPEHKLNIVQALQNKGHIVAMTGDGVNDAPALRRADIGVAMGITGTPVSKEASDMVLIDDNFATIVSAVEEGRTIYDNVRKFIKYILASNTGEVGVLVGSQALGMPLPLTTLQILYMNLVTDGIPALALGVEKSESNVMARPPYSPKESIFARGLGTHLVYVGAVLAIAVLSLAYWGYSGDVDGWETMVFMTLTLSQMGHALACRSDYESFFKIGAFTNKPLLAAVMITVLLQMALIYVPFLQDIFNTEALSLGQLAFCLVLSTILFWAVELRKVWLRQQMKTAAQ